MQGIHHITLITRKVQENVDFYAGFLGLRLVKRTAGFEDAEQLHLFYGDAVANPGSLITFLVWEDGSPGRVGHGAPAEIALAIRPEAIGFWLTRALQFNVQTAGPSQEFDEPVLRLTDPDGIIVKLVGVEDYGLVSPWTPRGIAEDDAIRGVRGATIWSDKPAETSAFLVGSFGLTSTAGAGGVERLVASGGDVIDIRDASGFWTAAPGTGTIDHVALRAADRDEVEAVHKKLTDEQAGATNVHDRTYFYSLYVREPGGALIEFASDGPGFGIDEPLETLGSELFIPSHFRFKESDVRVMLPQFGLPGEERITYRELPFVHRIHMPEDHDGSTLILLHGTGGTEASLLPLGRRLMPSARLIGLRGRSTVEGVARFFRRFGDGTFDQNDIRGEAEALAAFIEEARVAYGLDPNRTVFLGYSNGANMLGATMLLQPDSIKRAILLRATRVVEGALDADLSGASLLMVNGADDPYAAGAAHLREQLAAGGANIEEVTLSAGHEIAVADESAAGRWLTSAF